MKKKLDKDSAEYKVFGDVYRLLQEFYVLKTVDECSECLQKADGIVDKYKDIPLAEELVNVVTHDIHRRSEGYGGIV